MGQKLSFEWEELWSLHQAEAQLIGARGMTKSEICDGKLIRRTCKIADEKSRMHSLVRAKNSEKRPLTLTQ